MKFSSLALILILSALILSTSGCVRINTGNNIPTFGKQIVDLVDAHQSGVITTEEYNELRKRLMRTMLR
jgi:hypothetical protein